MKKMLLQMTSVSLQPVPSLLQILTIKVHPIINRKTPQGTRMEPARPSQM
jgi:hypothetical protein